MCATEQYYLYFTDDRTETEKENDMFSVTEWDTGKTGIKTHCPGFLRLNVGRTSPIFE